MTKIIGLTGGIASGKSTVSNYLRGLGYSVVDADQIARQVVEPGTVGLEKIVAAFGDGLLLPDGQLNRQQLAKAVFTDNRQLQTLNQILQPLIRQKITQQLTKLRAAGVPIVFLDAPLLFEQKYDSLCDLIMVITVSPQTQLKRLMTRDQLTVTQAQVRIKSQLPMALKVKQANVVIDNDTTRENTEQQVQHWLANVQN